MHPIGWARSAGVAKIAHGRASLGRQLRQPIRVYSQRWALRARKNCVALLGRAPGPRTPGMTTTGAHLVLTRVVERPRVVPELPGVAYSQRWPLRGGWGWGGGGSTGAEPLRGIHLMVEAEACRFKSSWPTPRRPLRLFHPCSRAAERDMAAPARRTERTSVVQQGLPGAPWPAWYGECNVNEVSQGGRRLWCGWHNEGVGAFLPRHEAFSSQQTIEAPAL